MAAAALSSLNRLREALRYSQGFYKSLLPAAFRPSRSRSSAKPAPVETLFSRIIPLAQPGISLVPELDDWAKSKAKIRAMELPNLVKELRKRNRHKQALEVSEWMKERGIFSSMPSDHAVRLDLIGKVHGLGSAEVYFDSLDEKDKGDKAYGALLSCYVRECLMEKSLSHMNKMKELGFASSALAYNNIMTLYTNTGQHEKVPSVLAEMKENGILPDNFSYRICINSYGSRSDINEMERVLEEMEHQPQIVVDWNTYAAVAHIYLRAGLKDKAMVALKKSEEKINRKYGLCYNHLISLYGTLGIKSEIQRLWELQKQVCKKHTNVDYITMLRTLVKFGELEEAETLLKEWGSSGNIFDLRVPNIVLVGYCEKGLTEKAEAMLEEFVEKGKTPLAVSWGILARAFVVKGEMKKAYEHMEKALCSYAPKEGWDPNPKVIRSLLQWLGDEADAKDVENFVKLLKCAMPADRRIYHALIKANIRAGNEIDGLLESMKADGIEEDESTKKIIKLKNPTDCKV
uniref:Pentatricopeptide repeat-containing protein At4g21705, mitochondrial n=1 Tax=Anthurium amnicola TaxID=1678845 RepID=A0A1D1XZQ2_9ARAE